MIKVIGWSEGDGIYTVKDFLKGEGGSSYPREKEDMVRGEERAFRFSLISRHLRWLQGEILTILEATMEDERKLKATKELVKDKISAKISWIYEQCGTPNEEQEALDDAEV